MRKLKYVIINNAGFSLPIVFDVLLEHRAFENFKVESAGFVFIYVHRNELQVDCWGESVSLNIVSKLEDTAIIKKMILKG